MRIRTIKPEFFVHEGIFEAELESKLPLRLAFIGLWCAADREGRFKWEPRRLGVQIMPYDQVDFSRVLDALTTRAFIVRYASTTGEFGYIPSFSRHQVINNRESASILPNPLECNQFDACPTRAPRDNHACKGEGKGREGNKEGKGKDKARGTLEEFIAYALEKGMEENDGHFFFLDCVEKQWKRGKEPIKCWKTSFDKWKSGGWLPSQKNKPNQQTEKPKFISPGIQEELNMTTL